MEKRRSSWTLHVSICYIFLFSQSMPLAQAALRSEATHHHFQSLELSDHSEERKDFLAYVHSGRAGEDALDLVDDDLSLGEMPPLPEVEGIPSGYLADNFQVTERGTAHYNIPLSFPEGIGGMSPQLSLHYDSRGGNGVLGMGWSMSGISSITRCSSTLAQDGRRDGVDFDEHDRYCLDGQRLVVVNDAPYGGPAEYRTENDIFTRITMDSSVVANGGHNAFQARTKDGLRYVYGGSQDSRIEAQGRTQALTWRVSKIIDTQADESGNAIFFDYIEDSINGEHYVDQIRYGGNAEAGIPDRYTIKFLYEERPDPFERYLVGSKVRTSKRIKEIQLFYEGDLQKFYRFEFDQGLSTKRSRLKSVEHCSSDGNCLLPTVFEWSEVPDKLENTELGGVGGAEHWAGPNWTPEYLNPDVELVDINGDGKVDILSFEYTGLYVAKSTGTGFAPTEKWALGDWRKDTLPRGIGDVTGDGIADVVVLRSNGLHVYESTQNGLLPPVQWSGYKFDKSVRYSVVDYTGDGKADILAQRNGQGLYLWESTGSEFLEPTQWSYWNRPRDFEVIDITGDGQLDVVSFDYLGLHVWRKPDDGLAYPEIWSDIIWSPQNRPHGLGNFSGTGIVDITVPQHDGFHVFRSNGSSFHAVYPWSVDWAPSFRADEIADLNADGYDDVISYQNDGLYVRLSNGFDFSDAVQWSAENWDADYHVPQAADFTGDGKPDFITFKSDGLWVSPTSEGMSDLLIGMTNGHGKETKVTYAPLTNSSVYNKIDHNMTYPSVQVQSPIYVVSNYQTSNGIGGMNLVTYSYRGLFYALDGRGFCGFNSITSVDHQSDFETIRVYEQSHPYKSLLKSSTTFSPEGNVLSFNTTNWATKWVDGDTNYFVYEASKYSEERTLAGEFLRATRVSTEVDHYGNPTKIIQADNVGNTTTTVSTYSNRVNDDRWHLGRLLNSKVTKYAVGQPALTRESSFEYDPVTGRLNKEIVEPNHPTLRLEKTYRRDNFGNIRFSTVTGPTIEPRVAETRYDVSGRFITWTMNPLEHSKYDQYYSATGLLRSSTDPNNLETTFEYDSFDRVSLETSPIGTEVRTSYFLADEDAPERAAHYTRIDRTGSVPEIAYYDLLDREIRKETVGVDGQTLYQDKQYNNRGLLEKESLPYFKGGTPQWTVYEYDDLGRAIKVTQPGNRITSTIYNGLTVTSTNPLGQKSTKITNVLGQDVIVRDHYNNEIAYTYDSYGHLIQTLDAYGNRVAIDYDILGNRKRVNDPDMGVYTYEYNELGELLVQIDAEEQRIEYEYDLLGRSTVRRDKEGETRWVYDTRRYGVGQLSEVSSPNYLKTYHYDSLSRVVREDTKIDSLLSRFSFTYDQLGRLAQTIYPSKFRIDYLYNAYGYQTQIRNGQNKQLLWQLLAQDARGNITRERYGNGLVTDRIYETDRSYLTNIRTGFGGGYEVQNLRYAFDDLGNLELRANDNHGLQETFTYDHLNRLTGTYAAGVGTHVDYDDLGNIIYKSDVGSYRYGENGAGPHAVTSIDGLKSNNYSYDVKGNRIGGDSQNISYTSFNKPSSIVKNGVQLAFTYGPARERIRQDKSGTANDFTRYYVGKAYQREESAGSTKHKHLIKAPTGLVAVHTIEAESVAHTRYVHRDHLGSTESLTDEFGNLVETLSYDAWGVRRNADDWTAAEQPLMSTIDEGFTGHEHLDDVGLVHMGGRVYDPVVGRFLSADPHIQAPDNLQSFNRYSYVLNNPLSFTDPSGFFFKKLFRALLKPFQPLLRNKFIRIAITIAILIATDGAAAPWLSGFHAAESYANGASFFEAASSFAVNLVSQDILQGLDTYLEVADGAKFLDAMHIKQVVAHGAVGGARSALSGGKFQHGFFSSGILKFIAPVFTASGDQGNDKDGGSSLVSSSDATASPVNGGSAANGGVTDSFEYLYESNPQIDLTVGLLQEIDTEEYVFFGMSTGLKLKFRALGGSAIGKKFTGAYDSLVDSPRSIYQMAVDPSVNSGLQLGGDFVGLFGYQPQVRLFETSKLLGGATVRGIDYLIPKALDYYTGEEGIGREVLDEYYLK